MADTYLRIPKWLTGLLWSVMLVSIGGILMNERRAAVMEEKLKSNDTWHSRTEVILTDMSKAISMNSKAIADSIMNRELITVLIDVQAKRIDQAEKRIERLEMLKP